MGKVDRALQTVSRLLYAFPTGLAHSIPCPHTQSTINNPCQLQKKRHESQPQGHQARLIFSLCCCSKLPKPLILASSLSREQNSLCYSSLSRSCQAGSRFLPHAFPYTCLVPSLYQELYQEALQTQKRCDPYQHGGWSSKDEKKTTQLQDVCQGPVRFSPPPQASSFLLNTYCSFF